MPAERDRRLRGQAGWEGSSVCDQAAWNRLSRRAGERGGARAGQVKVREDLGNHRRIFDRGDDLQAAPTLWAVINIDIEYAFEQARPTHARR